LHQQLSNHTTQTKFTMSILKSLQKYATDNNTATDVYYTALRLVTNMKIKANHDSKYKEVFNKWLTSGSTLALKEALAGVSYDENNLVHFNAMALLDTVAAKQ